MMIGFRREPRPGSSLCPIPEPRKINNQQKCGATAASPPAIGVKASSGIPKISDSSATTDLVSLAR
jgi:hypothetical protein